MQRRRFIQSSTAALTAGIAGTAVAADEIADAARRIGRLPRRKLGYSQRDVSILIGGGDFPQEAIEAGILAGVNFWHKADQWSADKTPAPQAILKNREAFICQVCADRVNGNHETGKIDAEQHYQFVKAALKQTGLRYFDDLQFHFGYHSVAEYKQNRSFIRAFERMKKEGMVRHLGLSQHSYAGNSRVPGGQNAAEILTAIVEDGLFEYAQFMYTYGDGPAMDKFLAFARQKNFGTIAMKTTMGLGRMRKDAALMKKFPAGVSPHNALARWLTTSTGLTAAVIRVKNVTELADTYSGAGKTMRAADRQAMELMLAHANGEVCRLCNECMPSCPQQIPISDILRFERYALDNGDYGVARGLYARLDRRADACEACGTCLSHCPHGLQIPEKLAATHELLS